MESRHPDASAEIAVECRDGTLRADSCPSESTHGQCRNDRLVGELFTPVLGGEFVAGGIVQDLGDLSRGSLTARFLDRDVHLTRDHDR